MHIYIYLIKTHRKKTDKTIVNEILIDKSEIILLNLLKEMECKRFFKAHST